VSFKYFQDTFPNPRLQKKYFDPQKRQSFSGTASYYKRLGLIGDEVDITDEETDINILFEMALQRLVFMPFGYLVKYMEK
jgi:glycopeptide antibiotics resistance protein